MSNSVDDDDEELSEPEEIHFPVFGSSASTLHQGKMLPFTWGQLLDGSLAVFFTFANKFTNNGLLVVVPPSYNVFGTTAQSLFTLQSLLVLLLAALTALTHRRIIYVF